MYQKMLSEAESRLDHTTIVRRGVLESLIVRHIEHRRSDANGIADLITVECFPHQSIFAESRGISRLSDSETRSITLSKHIAPLNASHPSIRAGCGIRGRRSLNVVPTVGSTHRRNDTRGLRLPVCVQSITI